MKNTENEIVFFDGECNLCSKSVQFILKHERNNKMKFCALQSEFAQTFLKNLGVSFQSQASIILVKNNEYFTASDALIHIGYNLKWYLRWMVVFKLIPAFIRNIVYFKIAKNRYKWFGRKERCYLPNGNTESRFITFK